MAINPLQAPTNYMAMAPKVDLGAQFAEFGQALADRQKRQQAEQVRKQFSDDLTAAQADGSQKAWTGMIAKHPQFREAFAAVSEGVGKERVNTEFTQAFQISNALENNAPDVAMSRVQTAIEAKKNAGEPTKIYEDVLFALQNGNIKGAQSGVNLALIATDPKRFEESVKARTTAATASSAETKAVAEASEAVAKATTAQATATNATELAAATLAKEKALAEEARVKAQFAEKNALADLQKKAADLGLTRAQTDTALASTKKLGKETAEIVLKLESLKATGGLDPKTVFEQEEKLRKEYQTRSKVYGELGTTFSNIKSSAGAKNGPGDIALITGFMKMLDPGSVVRETEFATARDTAGLFTQLQNRLEKAKNGQLLSPAQRKEYVDLSQKYLDSAQKQADQGKKALGVVVKNFRLNPENVFGPEIVETPVPPPPAPANRNVVVEY